MFRHVRSGSALAIGAATALVLTSCSGGVDADPGFSGCVERPVTCNSGERAEGGEVTWGLDGSWTGWNPVLTAEYTAFTLQVTGPIWPDTGHFDQESEFVLNDGVFAAEPKLISENPVQVEYALNPDATWGDGTPISRDDFVYNWYARSGDDAKCAGCTPYADSSSQVESIEASGSGSTIVITYDEDYSSSEWQYENVLASPAHIAEAEGFDWENDPEDMKASQDYFSETVPTWSTGPFRIESAETGDHVIFEPNPEWAGSTKPTLDRLTLRSFDSVESIITEMRQGNVDGATPTGVTAENIGQLAAEAGIDFSIAPGPGWGHIDLNTANEFLSDNALRTAVFQAIDVEELIDRTYANVQTDAARKLNHLFRNNSEYFEDHLTVTGQGAGDTELARTTLEEAGYDWDADGNLVTELGERVELDFRYADGSPDRETMAELVHYNLADIGVDVELNPFAVADLGTTLASSEFDMISYGWTTAPLYVGNAELYWDSDSAANYGQNEDPELDALLDELASVRDPGEAAEMANTVVQRVIEDAYVLPTVDTPVVIMVSEDLVNVRDNWASQQRALYNVAEWGIRDEDA
ncbi:ABC transporter family substrate-binding protein [Glycomyces buryatensis]|nr:ABC transporter family substrate-binding protein [Glycomyces buryatensis]